MENSIIKIIEIWKKRFDWDIVIPLSHKEFTSYIDDDNNHVFLVTFHHIPSLKFWKRGKFYK
jgi:hypothetical protein